MSRTRLLLVLTLAFVFIARTFGARDDEGLKSEMENKHESQRKNVPLDDDVYDALHSILSGERTFQDWPKKCDASLRQRVYKRWKSGVYELKDVHDPMVGSISKRIVEKESNSIVVKRSEVSKIVDCVYQETKGDGAAKLKIHTSHQYSGISRRIIQANLNSMKQNQKVRPLFQNKAPLRPIKAYKVQERHQVDLVSMASLPASIDGDTYKYIMSVIDIFSRFVFLRPLQTKESAEVAEHLLDIYNEHGPPEILQSDQGTEFKGVVKTICESLNVRIIKSAAYSPQTQGKDERSHRTWKEKVKFDILNGHHDDLNWVEYLPEYQKLYNESPHSSLGFLSPFEVYFGRPSNRLKNKLSLGKKNDFEVQEENYKIKQNIDELTKKEELRELADERVLVRQKALEASNNAAKNMVKRELKRQPPSLYYKGETILVRIPTSKKTVKGKKNSLKSSCEGRVVDIDHTAHKYQIEFKDPNTLKYKAAWFKVDDVTSLTKEDASKVKRTEAQFQNPSVLDISIDQILSAEKLNGDTVNLYFDFLREKHTCGMEDLCLGSSYFYPSLKESDDNKERYRKYIEKKSLWEYEDVIIPVHLGLEKHWLLVVISVLNLCIYIYDSVCSSLSTYIFNRILCTIRFWVLLNIHKQLL